MPWKFKVTSNYSRYFCCCCFLFKVFTPLFEFFTGPLSFRLANHVQRFGWGYSSKNPSHAWYLIVKLAPGVQILVFTVPKKTFLQWWGKSNLSFCARKLGFALPTRLDVSKLRFAKREIWKFATQDICSVSELIWLAVFINNSFTIWTDW